ncbi:PRC-barrel domain-containing protein [Ochrobactrum teleogrylli]|uniref:PRC-barrel domain containing protein n=1 Tax=Ochrobactrum teleogrylli TaxID=2479765 RepID=A0ABY2Y3S9_9HYPH|nr:PRC-barrel domain-containing protein [[Ochrobactrum] teleogrylli]TNV15947.1 PRC-barrel domain containing protein [[Ochrobactrum] teleogrylli]
MFRTTLLTAACALLIGAPALAQTAAPTATTPGTDAPAQQDLPVSTKNMFGAAPSPDNNKIGFVEPKEGEVLVSSFIGRSVYESDANDAKSIGKLNDLIVSADGSVVAAVIGVGGFLGVGEKDVAVSPDVLQLATRSDGNTWLVLSATKDQLTAAPAFDRSKVFTNGVADPNAAKESEAPASGETTTPATPATPAPAQ